MKFTCQDTEECGETFTLEESIREWPGHAARTRFVTVPGFNLVVEVEIQFEVICPLCNVAQCIWLQGKTTATIPLERIER